MRRRARSIVLATVKGDVHDIGKNLVDIIFTNNGYEVYNLGIKVPIAEMLDKADEVSADVIGMSGLLVKSTLIMRENLEEMNRRGYDQMPVLLGGAALARSYIDRDLRTVYKGKVFYGRDAFEGLRTIERLMEIKQSGIADPTFDSTVRTASYRNAIANGWPQSMSRHFPNRSPIRDRQRDIQATVPRHPSRQGNNLDDVSAYINETALFRNRWGYRPEQGESDADFKLHVRARSGATRRSKIRGRARSAGGLGIFCRELRGSGSHCLERRGSDLGADTVHLPPSTGRALPVYRRLLPLGRVR